MSRRQRKALSPSLFPFLAVLVCTLGTLILMLALVATGATQPAEDELPVDASQPAASLAEARQLSAEANFRLTQLIEFREAQTADAERKRSELTHLDQHTDQIRKQLAELNAEVEAASNQSQQPVDASELESMNDLLAARESELKKLKQQNEQLRRRVVIVPHRGNGGTLRRPIYLECGSNGLTIWPEGIHVSMDQLEIAATHRDVFEANPLDVALRTARQHAMKAYGDSEPPYPMLVVRPNGIDAYGLARAAMSDWDDQYGYELVDTDVELAFPPADPVLKQSLQEVIAQAASVQKRLQQIAYASGERNSGRNQDKPRLPSSRQKPRVISAADLARGGGMTGFDSKNEFRVGRHPNSLPADDPLADIVGDGLQDRFSGTDASGQFQPTGGGSALDQRDGGTAMDALASLHEAQQGADQSDPDRASDQLATHDDQGQAASENDPSGGPAASADELAGEFQPDAGTASMAGDGESESNSSDRPGGNSTMASMTPPPPLDTAPPRPGDPPRDGDQSANDSGPERQNQDQVDSTIDRNGDNWALTSNVRRGGTNTIIRSMSVEVSNDQIRIGGQTIHVDPAAPSEASRRVVLIAREIMGQWGPALAGGRWQPRLSATVTPGGQLRCDQLQRYLTNSGIEFTQRHQTASQPTSPRK